MQEMDGRHTIELAAIAQERRGLVGRDGHTALPGRQVRLYELNRREMEIRAALLGRPVGGLPGAGR